jgi:hypothetical protein
MIFPAMPYISVYCSVRRSWIWARNTYKEIKASTDRLPAYLGEVTGSLGDPRERGLPDNIAVGISVCKYSLPSCVLEKG